MPDLRRLIEMALKNAPFERVFASDGREADEYIQGENFDFYLIDIELPYINGYVLASRAIEKNPDALVVLTTAYDFQDTLPRTRLSGIAEIWLKPLSLLKLEKRMACAMQM
jgi:DNA-binding response OmpR family regulator